MRLDLELIHNKIHLSKSKEIRFVGEGKNHRYFPVIIKIRKRTTRLVSSRRGQDFYTISRS